MQTGRRPSLIDHAVLWVLNRTGVPATSYDLFEQMARHMPAARVPQEVWGAITVGMIGQSLSRMLRYLAPPMVQTSGRKLSDSTPHLTTRYVPLGGRFDTDAPLPRLLIGLDRSIVRTSRKTPRGAALITIDIDDAQTKMETARALAWHNPAVAQTLIRIAGDYQRSIANANEAHSRAKHKRRVHGG